MLIKTIRSKIGARCAVMPMPSSITYLAGKALGKMLDEMVPTRDEIRGLSRGLLVSRSVSPTWTVPLMVGAPVAGVFSDVSWGSDELTATVNETSSVPRSSPDRLFSE